MTDFKLTQLVSGGLWKLSARSGRGDVNRDDVFTFRQDQINAQLRQILEFLDRKRQPDDLPTSLLLAKLGIAKMVFEQFGQPEVPF